MCILPPLSADLVCSNQFGISGKCSLRAVVLQEYSSCLERWQASWLGTKSFFDQADYCRASVHLGGLEVLEISISPAHCFTDQLAWRSARHFLACLPVLCSFCRDLTVCAQACASSVRLSPLRMETLHLPVDVCGGRHITGALFEMSFYRWGNNGLPGPASGDHWRVAFHQASTALVALDLYNQTNSLNEESQWFLELLILATVIS